jgi:aminoglycoside phosphotransferase family enzyme/predicted kinase
MLSDAYLRPGKERAVIADDLIDPAVVTHENAATLIAALGKPAAYPHPVDAVRVIETHISWVLLTGSYAYKIKKPVNLGFLDFTTLAARRHYCEEELRLNRRLAPGLYLEVVPVTGGIAQPRLGGAGPALEYAVKMREFAQPALLDNALARGEVDAAIIERLAGTIADFHAELMPQDSAYGGDTRASVLAPARDNFSHMLRLLDDAAEIDALAAVRNWTLREFDRRRPQFEHRYAEGYVRECHGDLHLGNIALIDGAATPFDCIEFNPALRWMDVMSEVAFLMMDLEARGRRDLAFTFISAYLEASGDYAGVRLLPFYLVYRAIVRAKVHLMRAAQLDISPARRERAMAGYRRYIGYALAHTHSARGAVIITHGFSGSGKSTLARELRSTLGAICIRSDVERKRLHGMAAPARTGAATGGGIYTDSATERTYDSLLQHAHHIAGAGIPVVVDATFLKVAQRAAFRALAAELGVPFAIVDVTGTREELRDRVSTRSGDASEATLQVLDAQIACCENLTAEERRYAVHARGGQAATERNFRDQVALRLRQPLVVNA